METKKVKLLIEQEHQKGNIPDGAIYEFDNSLGFYVYKQNGVAVSSVNDAAVAAFPHLFMYV